MKIQLLERAIELDAACATRVKKRWPFRNPYALANLGGELFGVDDGRALKLLEKALERPALHLRARKSRKDQSSTLLCPALHQ